MEIVTYWLNYLLHFLGLQTGTMGGLSRIFVLLLIVAVAFLVDWICRKVVVQGIQKITLRTKVTWDDLVFNQRVLNNFCHILPPVIIYVLIPLAFPYELQALFWIRKLCMIYIIAASLRFVNIFLGVLFELTNQHEVFRDRPLKGVYQIIQVGLFFIGAIFIIAILLDKSPAHLLAGLGASAAILMLVFKDSIMGLVSGVQLSANDMLRPGDWITMPKYNADGTVIEVTLNTVKVRNFDNTITTIPPYALVSDSFQNWRGMQNSEGRRIKRSVNIDVDSVCFCSSEMLDRFRRIVLLKEYIETTEQKVRDYNVAHGIGDVDPVNGIHQTNLGVFRAYLELYLKNLPDINADLTYMVRQLQPTEKGIPLEIYCFSRVKDWVPYERIQADVFDHIFAVVPQFGLRIFQNPSSADFRRVFEGTTK